VRTMLQEYAKDEFMRYIGARPYERTEDRRDYRNGTRKRTLQTRFGVIEDIEIPLGRKAGIGYSGILERYRRKDSKIEDIVSDLPAAATVFFVKWLLTFFCLRALAMLSCSLSYCLVLRASSLPAAGRRMHAVMATL